MTEVKESKMQNLMDKAYATWKDNMNYDEFLASLSPVLRTAVVLGNLNYQVENGGFSQWIFNGYYKSGRNYLRYIKVQIDQVKYPQLTKAIDLALSKYNDTFLYAMEDRGEDAEENEKEASMDLEELDDEYYKLNKVVMEMEEFIEYLSSLTYFA